MWISTCCIFYILSNNNNNNKQCYQVRYKTNRFQSAHVEQNMIKNVKIWAINSCTTKIFELFMQDISSGRIQLFNMHEHQKRPKLIENNIKCVLY